jgi:hypothetical protein
MSKSRHRSRRQRSTAATIDCALRDERANSSPWRGLMCCCDPLLTNRTQT